MTGSNADTLVEGGLDGEGRLPTRPSSMAFDPIGQAAIKANWDASGRRLFASQPKGLDLG